ncbi:DUF4003 family protein [Paenibacillus silvae]|uniref:DUF4003 domain-containing protein n=1 Tax=Paenibacillus silvae TaxID=1325358 RepID=A0A2W6NK15_9BACL|nr:DUF4003 family protein [Paenibacillus silvae]PZT56252.1 hypothetical protein DN757_08045 [Paenibacillus silvae]
MHIEQVELFVSNTETIKKAFKWQHTAMHRMAALLYAAENRTADVEAIRQSNELIKQETKRFSAFRGHSAFIIAAMLSLTSDGPAKLQDTFHVYDLMKEMKFRTSEYLVIAAYQIATQAEPGQFQPVVERAKSFYDRMKAEHPFLTGRDDYIFTAMLALSGLELDSTVTRMEQLYQDLKPCFSAGNGLQSLTQILVMGEDHPEVSARVLALSDALRARKLRMDKLYTLPSLGLLSLLSADPEALADDVVNTYEWLREQKGFGAWSITKQELLLFSSALTMLEHVEHLRKDVLTTSMSTTITHMIIAQQAAMTAAIAASAASTASQSSN